MGAFPYIVGSGVILLVVAAATKAKASTTKPTSSTTKPTSSTTKPTSSTTPASLSVPLAIIEQVIKAGDMSVARNQAIWLTDNGYPKTGAALRDYAEGNIDLAELRRIATAEVVTPATTATIPHAQGTTELDKYGAYLLAEGTNDELFSYALTSTSIPLVSRAAARLAAAGDTRAVELTQHLADIST